jgi:hypothetical protein
MSSLDELIAAAAAKPKNTERADVLLGDEMVTFEFTQLPGLEWADLVAEHPKRKTSQIDAQVGFNGHSLAASLPLKYVRRVNGDVLEAVTVSQWASIFALLDGSAVEVIAGLLWVQNIAMPRGRVLEKKAALSATQPTKRSSPAKSARPSAASTGGNRAQRRSTTTKKAT